MSAVTVGTQTGLTTDEARRRLATVGPNPMPDTSAHLLRDVLGKFWAPVPWMLEAVIVVEREVVGGCAEKLAVGGDVGRDDRRAAQRRLDAGQPQPFVAARTHDH